MKKALFLDRDGIINVDHGYVYKKEAFEFVEDIFTVCLDAHNKGYEIFVITNQSGIARGKYTVEQFNQLTLWMVKQFKSKGIVIADVYHCPHHPDKGVGEYKVACDCRKPEPGMILSAAKKHDIDLAKSIFIGDKVSDMQAAERAGIKSRILLVDQYSDNEAIKADRINKISEASAYIS
ncbi:MULTISPECIES: D-glycero-beta-D-manno-heptose 1,7-bisphosphate 7-phosphatase [unclassified Colwellia]|jgi:D-glycero-D-manno-heptose 1,7-bisphosphate phosphatase|uniref:D-glycero-beta-D-manno-heptose 1,7-bisphosphate 7-phosphatase n=1 Tax=unclassified Colwellia TaxID=196834 RepID=UPI0015F6C197|nr:MULTISPECIES: D-glycero-beta-D-manno-heptose 1,7-bisphosphate 7-phosphatase [unclassified Colwellia]MBA6362718.1 D-glycero-beta-D-manno-heptose 1,7-bisphosphate 7-phosphatase [Colwellia sp. BRX8-8]MBA6339038.1 D-glycero-beta-D-manno-heptose 1,7-bisphosphate 7-phosphatase [Colwellia sp. BRX8-7]MBA6350241.1 D-glycero-beta-D-manno-heptose 1,7-bisphosphate 7-phosphatase [Colwellia sp. BRX8-9]MBA6354014.1 D-glycero-beta-D-manno-heptose 1,7-bisphosphate 7-phosphatase [Colwellia sp. BRX9-1]MBA6357